MFVSSGKAQIAYEIAGEAGAGRDVLLIHAGVADRRSWSTVIAHLTPPHRCVSYDQRRHGETTYEPQDGWSPIDDALAVVDAAEMGRPVIVGCSKGGGIAIDFALAHPERVAGLVLMAPAVGGAPDIDADPGGHLAALSAAMTAADARGDIDALMRLEAHLWLDGPAAPEGRVGGEARALFVDMDRRAELAADPGEIADIAPAWDRLGEIAAPTLVLTGRLDTEPLQIRGPMLAERIPHAAFRWLEGVAHLPHMENDAATFSAISGFVGSLPGSGGLGAHN
jgi:pimeloyl-ACP methyl ester carboxylesterase